MTEVFIFTLGAVCGIYFGFFIAALMAIDAKEDRMRENALDMCPENDFCPAEDCIGCENTKCIMHPVDDDD